MMGRTPKEVFTVEMVNALKIVNCYPEHCMNALQNAYRGRVYVVLMSGNGAAMTFKKTRKGAEGYISRHSTPYYDDYTQSMVSSAYDIAEIDAADVHDPRSDVRPWYHWLHDVNGATYMYRNVQLTAEHMTDIDPSVVKFVTDCLADMDATGGMRVIDEYEDRKPAEYVQAVEEMAATVETPEAEQKTLIFEGAGWDGADSSTLSGVGNCRIRTRLRNNDGRLIYLEMSGFIHQGKKPAFAQPFFCVGHVTDCFYADSEWDSRRGSSSDLHFEPSHFEYNKETIVKLVNHNLNCSFTDLEVVNDGSIRVHGTADALCESITSGYVPYADPVVDISALDGITPLYSWERFNMAKYALSFEFVKSLPFIRSWMDDRLDHERAKLPSYRYYIHMRWNEDGRIVDANISSDTGTFAHFGIGLDVLQLAIQELTEQNAERQQAGA